jgi:hypothetical protein
VDDRHLPVKGMSTPASRSVLSMRRSAGDTLILGPRSLAVSRKHQENRPSFAA